MSVGSVRLPDGRKLAYARWGPPDGRPVLECHGNPGSRTLLWDESALHRRGVHLLTADRPGIGGSTPLPGRRVVDWAGDVAVLLDALELDRVAVLGYSAGGAYAAGCAAALGGRITSLALVGSIVPLDDPTTFRELGRRPEWLLSRRAPPLARIAGAAQRQLLRRAPRAVATAFLAALSPSDRALVRGDRALVERGIVMGLEATRQGGAGLVEDLRAVMRPWGFRLGDIRVPTTVWQGEKDGSIPSGWGRRLSETIPGATLRTCPDEGHLLPAARFDEILGPLVGHGMRSAAPP